MDDRRSLSVPVPPGSRLPNETAGEPADILRQDHWLYRAPEFTQAGEGRNPVVPGGESLPAPARTVPPGVGSFIDSGRNPAVEAILHELSRRSRGGRPEERSLRVDVLMAEHFVGMEEGLSAIRKMAEGATPLRMRLHVEDAVLRRYSPEEIARLSGVSEIVWPAANSSAAPAFNPADEADALFLPVLSLGLLSRLAALDTGDPFTGRIIPALCAGKPVGALLPGGEPDHFLRNEKGLSHASFPLKEEIRRLCAKAESYGVAMLPPDKAVAWLSASSSRQPKKQTITAEDIEAARKLGRSSLLLPRSAIVTPLAADLARDYRIELLTDPT